MSEFNHVKIETDYSNCFIVPYTTDENYINAVNTIINLLKKYVSTDSIVLTEGEYSYIHYRHDVVDYAREYGLQHLHHFRVCSCINKEKPLENIKFIINIGTWSADIVSNDFINDNPNIMVIHIQNSIMPRQYSADYFENLQRFNTELNTLVNNLTFQFQNQLLCKAGHD